MPDYILAIDQGTTSSRAIVFNPHGEILGTDQQEFKQSYPADGWVEHDPEEIWASSLSTCKGALVAAGIKASDVNAIGITNQRETTVVWDRATGTPIYPAIVWQDRRTAVLCDSLRADASNGQLIQSTTGLLLDPYFSATKIRWILDYVDGAQAKAEAGNLLFGTIDSFLLWRLTGGASHKTDATNAARTMLFNIHQQEWDAELLALFNIPLAMLPTVEDSSAAFGHTQSELLGAAIPITGIAGDQQAALIGQACFHPGMAKSTYGTGCFYISNTGEHAVQSHNKLLTTVAYRLNGKTTYALEGSIFIAGASMQWLRDGLKLFPNAADSEGLAESIPVDHGVYLVPAFTGMGAPYWDANARGAIFGLSRDTGIREIASAGLQAVAYQTRDLVTAMEQDGAAKSQTLRVDGGMSVNNWMVQFLADILKVDIDRPKVTETTALGAAYLAGLGVGIYKSLDDIEKLWSKEASFSPKLPEETADKLYKNWLYSVAKVCPDFCPE